MVSRFGYKEHCHFGGFFRSRCHASRAMILVSRFAVTSSVLAIWYCPVSAAF